MLFPSQSASRTPPPPRIFQKRRFPTLDLGPWTLDLGLPFLIPLSSLFFPTHCSVLITQSLLFFWASPCSSSACRSRATRCGAMDRRTKGFFPDRVGVSLGGLSRIRQILPQNN